MMWWYEDDLKEYDNGKRHKEGKEKQEYSDRATGVAAAQ